MKPIDRFFIVLFVCVMCLGIASIAEEITLTTYYPAPYGAYEELTTTGNTYLATDSGSVGIGTTGPGSGKLAVNVDGTRNLKIRSTIDLANSVALWSVNNAETTNYPMEFRAADYLFTNVGTKLSIMGGNVGIGTTYPTAKLHVNGNIKAVLNSAAGSPMKYNSTTGEIGFDIAELFEATQEVEAGDLLVIDETEDLKLRKNSRPYEKGIIGVVSGSPAILFEGSELNIAPAPGGFTKGTRPPVALAGRIKCKVSLENGPIEKGDLLTSSSAPGYAMKATDRDKSFGAIVGKALEPFDGGPDAEETGEILILITLQ